MVNPPTDGNNFITSTALGSSFKLSSGLIAHKHLFGLKEDLYFT